MTVMPTTLKRTCATPGLAVLGLAAVFFAAMQPAFAQSESSWSNQGLIYLLGPTLDGTSGIGPIHTDVDMSASDVFETLDGAFLGMSRGEGERWGVLIAVVYMDLKAEGAGDGGAFSAEAGVEQTTAIASATYRPPPATPMMAGAP